MILCFDRSEAKYYVPGSRSSVWYSSTGWNQEADWGHKSRNLSNPKENRPAAMHELAIAQNILEIVRQSVPEAEEPAVRRIRMRVGQLSGVVPESLDFCFSAIVSETMLQQARLAIEPVPTISRCRDCALQFRIEELVFLCPACKSGNLELISGKELEIVEIELVDSNEAP
jgi:hydrogenase nickel incorporation protein HypA/HybF